MAKVDPRDFLLNTDYEMDKIIYARDFEWEVSAITNIEVAHELPTAPLIFGVWSTNPDFSNANEIGDFGDPWNQSLKLAARANKQKIKFQLTPKLENNAYVTTKFYAKVFGFEPGFNWPLPDGEVLKLKGSKMPTTSKHAKTFILNTDYNYLKLYTSGDILEYNPQTQIATYDHNFGYIPQIISWFTLGPEGYDVYDNITFDARDGWFNYEIDNGTDRSSGLFVDDKTIYEKGGVSLGGYVIRVYADEA